MKRLCFALCLLAVLMTAMLYVSAAESKIWDFTTSEALNDWAPNSHIAHELGPNGTRFYPAPGENNDMFLEYKGSALKLDDYEVFAAGYSGFEGNGDRLQFYHWTDNGADAAFINIYLEKGEQIFKVNMKNNAPESAHWSGNVTRLRLDPLRGYGDRSVTLQFVGLFATEADYMDYISKINPEILTKPGFIIQPGDTTYNFGDVCSMCYVDTDYVNGYAIVTSTNGPDVGGTGDCHITMSADMTAEEYPWIKMRIRNLSDATAFEMHFATTATGGSVAASSCTHFPITTRDEDFKEYVFNVADYNLQSMAINEIDMNESVWKGHVSSIRFDTMWMAEPSGQMPTGSQMYIDYIAFLPSEQAARDFNPETTSDQTVNTGSGEAPSWILKKDEDMAKFALSQLDSSIEAGIAKFHPTGEDPTISIAFTDDEVFDTQEFKYFAMHYNIKSTVNFGGLFYTTDTLTSLSDKSFSFFLINPRGEWSDLIIDLSTYPKQSWNGKCTSIRLDPINSLDMDAEIAIERLGFFRTKEEAANFLAQSDTNADYSVSTTFTGDLQKVIVAPGSLYEGYNQADFMLSSTVPQGTPAGESPVVINTKADGSSEVVALGFTNSYGYTTMSVNKPGNYTLGYNHKEYSDIAGHWGEKYINFVSDRALFGGTSPTEFSPEMPMTRGMFITVLGRMHGVDTSKYDGNTGYGDVPASEYYAPYIQWAKQNGLMNGLSDVTFGAEDPIYRETMALVISNYLSKFGYSIFSLNDKIEFTDISGCDAQTIEAINAAQKAGIINGKGDGLFDPKGYSTRAEVSAVMQRVIKTILGVNDVDTSYTPDYFQRKRIRIGVWGFQDTQSTEKGMNYLRDLGADMIVSGTATYGNNQNYVLSYTDKYGIEVIVTDLPTNTILADDSEFDYKTLVAAYAEHPSFSGNFVMDEPGTDDFAKLGKLSSDYMKALPGKIPVTNLLPMYANAAQLKYGARAAAIEYYDADPNLYRNYCEQWFENFDCDYICTDIYPLNWVGNEREAANKTTYKDYVESINQIATVAREHGKEFWCCIQTFGWQSSKRTPTEAEYRWQCYSMLSFGCTGILLWTYISGPNSIMHGGTLEPNPAYYDCKTVMWEMRDISDVFVQYNNLGAYTHNGSAVPYLHMTGEYKDFSTISSIDCTEPLLIGCFEKQDKTSTAFTIVNMAEFSSEKSAVVKVQLADTSKTVTSYYRGKPTVVTPVDGYYTFNLENGDGVFVTVG